MGDDGRRADIRRDHEVLLWSRNPEVAAEVNEHRTDVAYLPDSWLPARLRATAALEQASGHPELLVVGVPTGSSCLTSSPSMVTVTAGTLR